MLISIALKILILSEMKKMQHAMTRTIAKEDKKQEKNKRDRLEAAEACERKEGD